MISIFFLSIVTSWSCHVILFIMANSSAVGRSIGAFALHYDVTRVPRNSNCLSKHFVYSTIDMQYKNFLMNLNHKIVKNIGSINNSRLQLTVEIQKSLHLWLFNWSLNVASSRRVVTSLADSLSSIKRHSKNGAVDLWHFYLEINFFFFLFLFM